MVAGAFAYFQFDDVVLCWPAFLAHSYRHGAYNLESARFESRSVRIFVIVVVHIK